MSAELPEPMIFGFLDEGGTWVRQLGYTEAQLRAVIAAERKQPLLSSDIVTMYAECPTSDSDMIKFARAVERAHGIGVKP